MASKIEVGQLKFTDKITLDFSGAALSDVPSPYGQRPKDHTSSFDGFFEKPGMADGSAGVLSSYARGDHTHFPETFARVSGDYVLSSSLYPVEFRKYNAPEFVVGTISADGSYEVFLSSSSSEDPHPRRDLASGTRGGFLELRETDEGLLSAGRWLRAIAYFPGWGVMRSREGYSLDSRRWLSGVYDPKTPEDTGTENFRAMDGGKDPVKYNSESVGQAAADDVFVRGVEVGASLAGRTYDFGAGSSLEDVLKRIVRDLGGSVRE